MCDILEVTPADLVVTTTANIAPRKAGAGGPGHGPTPAGPHATGLMSRTYTAEQYELWYVRCARPSSTVRWPDGQVCRTCQDRAFRTKGRCPGCGNDRLLAGRRVEDQAAICTRCAGFSISYACAERGQEGKLHAYRQSQVGHRRDDVHQCRPFAEAELVHTGAVTALALDTGLSPGRVLVIHAHPDDEVFATAAATIALADRGCQVSLRVGTGGEAGLLAAHQGDSASARATRAAQLTRSCKLLGIEDWEYLAEAGQWIDTGHGGPGTLAEEDPAHALLRVNPDEP